MFNEIYKRAARAFALVAMLTPIAQTAQAQDVNLQWMSRLSSYKGDTRCVYGAEDCNRCANNVRSKFSAFKGAGGRNFEFTYATDRAYPPSLKKPKDFLSVQPSGGKHLQTFTRMGLEDADGNAWFGVTYGSLGADASTMFLVTAPVNSAGDVSGNAQMVFAYPAWDRHPGGSQGLGKYLLISHDELDLGRGGYLEIYNLTSKHAGTRVRVPVFGDKRVAAVGAARLAGGGVIVASKRAGDDPAESRNWYDFYYADSVVGGLPGWQHLGTAEGHGQQVENLSLVTECGTGDIYMVTGQGDDSGSGTNYWRLLQLQQTASTLAPRLVLVDSANKNQDLDCDARAAGTAYVSRDGNLAFYCAQKLALDSDAAIACSLGVLPACAVAATVDNNMTFRQYW